MSPKPSIDNLQLLMTKGQGRQPDLSEILRVTHRSQIKHSKIKYQSFYRASNAARKPIIPDKNKISHSIVLIPTIDKSLNSVGLPDVFISTLGQLPEMGAIYHLLSQMKDSISESFFLV